MNECNLAVYRQKEEKGIKYSDIEAMARDIAKGMSASDIAALDRNQTPEMLKVILEKNNAR